MPIIQESLALNQRMQPDKSNGVGIDIDSLRGTLAGTEDATRISRTGKIQGTALPPLK
jgi:hypothetical protein